MDMSDLKALLDPISGEAQCGPDLDAAGDPMYVELGIAAEWREAKPSARMKSLPRARRTVAKHYVAALA
jgi:hypothetical protein